MSNLPTQHHGLNTHARHLDKALTALLWTACFRWTATLVIDRLLGGNGLTRKLIDQKLLVEHPISNPFSPVRYYTTLSKEGLALLQRHWNEIGCSVHGHLAMCLSSYFSLPPRPDHRIRKARFEHDLHVQLKVAALVRRYGMRLDGLHLADEIERTPPAKRPSKIPDAIIDLRSKSFPADRTISKVWIEIELSRKNAREIDVFCAFYRAALAGITEKKFQGLGIYCHPSVLAQWRRDFARTIIPKWHFREEKRTWVRLEPKDWHRFPELSDEDLDRYIMPLAPTPSRKKSSAAQAPARDAPSASGHRSA